MGSPSQGTEGDEIAAAQAEDEEIQQLVNLKKVVGNVSHCPMSRFCRSMHLYGHSWKSGAPGW